MKTKTILLSLLSILIYFNSNAQSQEELKKIDELLYKSVLKDAFPHRIFKDSTALYAIKLFIEVVKEDGNQVVHVKFDDPYFDKVFEHKEALKSINYLPFMESGDSLKLVKSFHFLFADSNNYNDMISLSSVWKFFMNGTSKNPTGFVELGITKIVYDNTVYY